MRTPSKVSSYQQILVHLRFPVDSQRSLSARVAGFTPQPYASSSCRSVVSRWPSDQDLVSIKNSIITTRQVTTRKGRERSMRLEKEDMNIRSSTSKQVLVPGTDESEKILHRPKDTKYYSTAQGNSPSTTHPLPRPTRRV